MLVPAEAKDAIPLAVDKLPIRPEASRRGRRLLDALNQSWPPSDLASASARQLLKRDLGNKSTLGFSTTVRPFPALCAFLLLHSPTSAAEQRHTLMSSRFPIPYLVGSPPAPPPSNAPFHPPSSLPPCPWVSTLPVQPAAAGRLDSPTRCFSTLTSPLD